ncbi:MAG TPA: ADP/ATP-dependent (S)-NAD(P)H-hydrate dehydratase [Plantibacter sp.]|uniref:ADP-dependent NAD(P)H-hydrate dehydratase n=1 Tax=unclassified Plantibacter TaxID=2624265 RepID=UPI002BEDDF81|nr:ADP/ATP-dependent (S)-NAD(P)H-hydrate dehydratase [Plantibacter sp.]
MPNADATELSPAELAAWPLPDPGSSKDDRGSVLVIGGARRTPGAVVLAGGAALRVGAGRVTLAVAESAAPSLAIAFPEAAVIGLRETPEGAVVGTDVERLRGSIDVDCVLIGPGLDDAQEATSLLLSLRPLLGDTSVVVLDAFALGALPDAHAFTDGLGGRLVFTPNLTEAAILLGTDEADSESAAFDVAARYDATVTCQGRISDGAEQYVVSGGGPMLGTAGSGDVLAGAIAGLAARGLPPLGACAWGTLLHAASGDRLAERTGPLGALAREFADEFPRLLRGYEASIRHALGSPDEAPDDFERPASAT